MRCALSARSRLTRVCSTARYSSPARSLARQWWSSNRLFSVDTSTSRGAAGSPPSPASHPSPSSPPSFTSTPTPPSGSPPPPPSTPLPLPPSSSAVRGPVSWKSFTLLAIASAVVVGYYQYEKERKQTAFQPVVSIGRAALGGPFSLVSADGAPTSSTDLQGRYLMVYFGFTHCPDICPTELRKMEEALALYGQHFPQHPITPVFISIDPHRDTPERLRAYRQQYSPTFLFLTGSPDAIKEVAKSYRVYYSAPEGEGDDYLVDHSIFFYLLDRQGEVMDYYGKNLTADEIARKLCTIIPADNHAPSKGKK